MLYYVYYAASQLVFVPVLQTVERDRCYGNGNDGANKAAKDAGLTFYVAVSLSFFVLLSAGKQAIMLK